MARVKIWVSTLVLAAAMSSVTSGPVAADWRTCKTYDVDYYGQNICVELPYIGPEGGVYCFAGTWRCVVSQLCVWA